MKVFFYIYLTFLVSSKKQTKYIQRSRKHNRGLSIDDRSPDVDERTEFGHWEVDTIHGKRESRNLCW